MGLLKKKWAELGYGLQMDRKAASRLTNLRFADDLMLVGYSRDNVCRMLADLDAAASTVGLEIHLGKTNIMCNEIAWSDSGNEDLVYVAGKKVKVLGPDQSTPYLGREFSMGDLHDTELKSRIAKGWGKFRKYSKELLDPDCPLRQRIKLFNSVVTPTVLYGIST